MKTKQMLLFPLVVFLIASCATSPLGRKQLLVLDDAQVATMGLQSFDNIKKEKPIATDSKANDYVRCVARHITAEIGGDWEVVVFEGEEANAFALPGGKIGVYTGMLKVAENQDQLAAVMAHEVSHVLSKHGNERVSQQMVVQTGLSVGAAVLQTKTKYAATIMGALGVGAEVGVLLPYSRIQETEADLHGMDLMAQAGFNPQASVALWENMQKANDGNQPPVFLSTHPSHSNRIMELKNRMHRGMALYNKAQQEGKNPNCQ